MSNRSHRGDTVAARAATPVSRRGLRAHGGTLADIVRDFIGAYSEMGRMLGAFREGRLRFDHVRGLVADADSSVLFRLKERVHARFRDRAKDETLLRAEVLFDLAVGSLFHEALKFRENFYQVDVYGPKVVALRVEGDTQSDGLLKEFDKILASAADRLRESLHEAEALLEQTRRQLLVLLADSSHRSASEAGLVTRYLIENRDAVEEVYPEGLDTVLEGLHGSRSQATLCAVRSHLASARFAEAITLIGSRPIPAGDPDSDELAQLHEYARGMAAFLSRESQPALEALAAWIDLPGCAPDPGHRDFALVALRGIPELVAADDRVPVAKTAAALARRLEEVALAGPPE